MKEFALIKHTSDTTGTGDLTLNAASSGFRAFSDAFTLRPVSGFYSSPTYVPYSAINADGSEWEVGACQIQDDGANGTLNRSGNGSVVFESSNSGSLVNFTGSVVIRHITPPMIRSFERGCYLFGSTGETLSNGTRINWTTESEDTDDCWTIGDDELIYIPLWANEVQVWWDIEYLSIAATDRVLGVRIENFNCKNTDIYVEGFMENTTNYKCYLTGQCTLAVEPSNISGNPVSNGSRASFRVTVINPDGLSVTTSDTSRLRMRILR